MRFYKKGFFYSLIHRGALPLGECANKRDATDPSSPAPRSEGRTGAQKIRLLDFSKETSCHTGFTAPSTHETNPLGIGVLQSGQPIPSFVLTSSTLTSILRALHQETDAF